MASGNNTETNAVSAANILVKFLDKVYGTVSEYLMNEDGSPKCLYFQDSSMKDMFNFYPDRICIDSTFHRLDIDIFMKIFLCEDSNGRSNIIAVGFIRSNDVESLTWLFETFKIHNPNWRKIKSLAVDSEIKLREIIRESFPLPLIIISYFHAYITFKSDIKELKQLGLISEEQRLYANDLFKNMFFAHNQSEFEIRYQLFLSLPSSIVSYFKEAWMSKQHEWRIPLDYKYEDVFFQRNSFLQILTNDIAAIYAGQSNYIEFIKKIFLCITLKKKERPGMGLQPVSFLYSRFSPEYQISKALTPYAANFVIKQLDLSNEISTDVNAVTDTYIFDYLGMSVSASATACSCHFFLFTLLPCRHIFAVRKINYLCVFDESLVDYAWNIKYYQHTLTCIQDYLDQGTERRIPQDAKSRNTLAAHLFEVFTSSVLHSSKEVFESRFQVLKRLVRAWKNNDDISLQFLGIEKNGRAVKNYPSSSTVTTILNIPSSTERSVILSPADVPSSSAVSSSFIIPVSSSNPTAAEISSCIQHPSDVQNSPVASCSSTPYFSPRISSSSNYYSKLGSENLSIVNFTQVLNSNESGNSEANERSEGQLLSNFNSNILNSTHINMTYICYVICASKDTCVEWLKSMGIIAASMTCPTCNSAMISKSISRLSDGVVWCCTKIGENKKCCSKRCSVRSGSWLELSNMTLMQILRFCYMWVNKFRKNIILFEIGTSLTNYVSWSKFMSRVCEECLNRPSFLVDQNETAGYKSTLDMWLQQNAGEDLFIKFLKDASFLYEKDSIKAALKNDIE